MRFKLKYLLPILLFGVCFSASAQVEKDFGVRAAVSYNSDLTKDIGLSLKEEIRLEDNATSLAKSYTTLGLDYKLRRWIRFGVNYRFILKKRGDESYGQRHRVMADLKLRTYQHRYTLTYRARIQSEVRTYNYTHEYGFAPTADFRNTFQLKYTINRIYQPYATFDLRFKLRDVRTPDFTGFDRSRFTAGLNIALAQKRELEVYFMTYRHWNTVEPDRVFVIGVEFSFGSRGMLFGS